MLVGQMLDGVDAVAIKPEVVQGAQADLLLFDNPVVEVQIGQARQPALLRFPGVVPVVDVAFGVEVPAAEQVHVEVAVQPIRRKGRSLVPVASQLLAARKVVRVVAVLLVRHVVEHHVGIGAHGFRVQRVDGSLDIGLPAQMRTDHAIVLRLVPLPPVPSVFVAVERWGQQHTAGSTGS